MECLWSRTLASVLLLLFPHQYLCQNVPTGPLQPPPLVKQPLREGAAMNPGLNVQGINLIPFPNGVLSDSVPRSQCLPEYQRIPESIKPAYQQTCNPSVLQTNIGPISQIAFGPPQINSLQLIPGPVCNTLPKTNIPTSQATLALPLNIKSTSTANKPVSKLPNQEVSRQKPTIQCSNFDISSPITNLPLFQPKNSPNIIIPNSQNQVLSSSCATCPSSQRLPLTTTLVPATGPILNTPSSGGFVNQNTLKLPLVSNPCLKSFVQSPVSNSFTNKVTPDLTSVNFLPTPNLPSSAPVQSYSCTSISQIPVQPVAYPKPIAPAKCVSNTPILPSCQISALPPVVPVNVPQLISSIGCNPVPVPEQYNPVPISLQINVPPPIIPEPQITIITAYPPAPAAAVTPDNSDVLYGLYPPYPLPPIIIEGRRSRTRSWLPLILIALIANDDCCGGGCCYCPCDAGCSDIPIPYPIPIPTNNPIIIGSGNRSPKNSTG